jgi:hypothetical protein
MFGNGYQEWMDLTHTYAILEISSAAFKEIKEKLEAAGYHHVFCEDGTVMDMHGIALKDDGTKIKES